MPLVLTQSGTLVWRQYNTDGVSGSGNHQPVQADIVVWARELEARASNGLNFSVKDRDLSTPPGSPAVGDRYILGPGSLGGAWSAFLNNDIVEWNGSAWLRETPGKERRAWIDDESAAALYTGSAWKQQFPVGGLTPQGRLTIQSGTPIQTADQLTKTTIFYAPFLGQYLPLYDGSDIRATSFLSGPTDDVGLSFVMAGSANWPIGSVFDIFATLIAGVPTLCSCVWTSTTSRGTGANTPELQLFAGLKTNKNQMTNARTASGVITVVANQGLYLGTFYATANGTTAMSIHPNAASGGSNNFLGLYNAHNARPIIAKSQDSTTSWTYASSTTRLANNNANNRINFIDGEGIRQWRAWYGVSVAPGSASANAATVGVEIDNISNFSGGAGAGAHLGQAAFVGATQFGCQVSGFYAPYPITNGQGSFLGLHFAQAMEQSTAVSMTFFGNDFMMLTFEWDN